MKVFVEPREFSRMCVFWSGWVGVNEVEQLTLDATDEHSDLIFIPDWLQHIQQYVPFLGSNVIRLHVFVCEEGRCWRLNMT